MGCSFSTRPHLLSHVVQGSPLVVLNSFSGEEHLKLATVLFQNLFPSINVQNIQLHQCQVSTQLRKWQPHMQWMMSSVHQGAPMSGRNLAASNWCKQWVKRCSTSAKCAAQCSNGCFALGG